MTGFFTAVVVFFTIVGIISALRADEDALDAMADQPRKLPDPGARDIYTLTGSLSRADVPSWG
ncbi:MAG: hypothetical protein ABI200_05720 [Gaiellales bacterium]